MAEIIKNLGGDRIGSGNKNNIRLHNYERSTHNLSKRWKSSMAPGVLYPCYTNIALNGDTFDIDLDAACRTIPTQGPLFDTFKLQVDVYTIPMRLYQGLLHNNALEIGMKMEQVKMPLYAVKSSRKYMERFAKNFKTSQINNSSLLKYLGLSGIGVPEDMGEYEIEERINYRYINALPILAYYDIFKCYYANKQEEDAYVINNYVSELQEVSNVKEIYISMENMPIGSNVPPYVLQFIKYDVDSDDEIVGAPYIRYGQILKIAKNVAPYETYIIANYPGATTGYNIVYLVNNSELFRIYMEDDNFYYLQYKGTSQLQLVGIEASGEQPVWNTELHDFPLKNIDEMRNLILSHNTLNSTFYVSDYNKFPYQALQQYWCRNSNDSEAVWFFGNTQPMQGLVLKTYQSDMFNNWVQTEWIDGENGINAITAIDTSDGNFTLDTLNLAQKVYNMMNRIAVSGGTWSDWQEAVYSEKAIRHAETPIYCGGMSSEVVFEEIISNTNVTNSYDGSQEPMGTLGGRGKLDNIKYGKLHIKISEPSIIMAIASLTPRITYTQGNKWYLTELMTFNDLHKPALDGIGFQDLIGEQMAWWDTHWTQQGGGFTKHSIGKIPAWMNYMTDVNEAFGDFAEPDGKSYMILNRDYDYDATDFTVTDFTTYIDPAKYNYAFAYSDTKAQNFWVQVNFNIKARRKMSAKQIPNL